jgi:small-conductance mechanosensitive channel/CRP-like cAMP-binding protein
MPNSILSDPISQFVALVALGVALRVLFGRNPTLRLIANVAFFFLLTTLLLYHNIAPYSLDTMPENLTRRIFVGMAKATWWIGGAMVLVSSVRLFLILENTPREGRLLQDLLVGLIYVGAALSIVAYVFSVPVGTLIATSGAFAIVLGLAMQSTLADVFSGIALNLGRPYTLGDWIVLDASTQGKVVETNWRSTHLLNGTNDLVVVPNSALAKARIVNLTMPDASHGVAITVRVVPTTSPAVIEGTMRNVLLSSNSVLKSPAPSVTIIDLDANAAVVELAFRVAGIGDIGRAKNEIFDLVFRHTKAAGLKLAHPSGSVAISSEEHDEVAPKHPGTPWKLLNSIALFSTLTEDEKEILAGGMTRVTFKKDAVIAAQGTALTSLVIVRSGVLISEKDTGTHLVELSRLAPGDCFGERGVLMGALEPGTIRALTFVVAYEIPKDLLAGVMRERPAMAEDLAVLLSKRIESEKLLSEPGENDGGHGATSLAARILHLFQIQHGVS